MIALIQSSATTAGTKNPVVLSFMGVAFIAILGVIVLSIIRGRR